MPGCIQPMSSPMIKRMLGLAGACAVAGKLNANKAMPETSRLPIRRLILMFEILRCELDRLLGSCFELPYAECSNRSSLFASGHRSGGRLLYRSDDFPQVALHTLCDFGRFIFLIDFLRSVDE